MKGFFGRRFFQNKWVVPLSAMILTLCIGSFALASTAKHDSYSFIPPGSTSTTATTQATAAAPTTSTTVLPGLPLQTLATGTVTTLSAADLELQQAKENAILGLIREKMTADDQATFDQLRAVAADQQATLLKAQADLEGTKTQINALIDKYLGVANGLDLALATGSTTSSTVWKHLPE
jgi:hypothetical protein